MKRYIDKDKVVAELEKRRKSNSKNKLNLPAAFEDNYLLSFLNSLEVKEVDLDKEARHYLLNEHKSPLSTVFHQTNLHSELQYHEDIENAFKAGLKLGLKTQKEDKL